MMVLCSSFSFYSNHSDKEKIKLMQCLIHKAAGGAQFDAYFNLMTADAIFIGTDATENWNAISSFC
jgi:hypothetical protein